MREEERGGGGVPKMVNYVCVCVRVCEHRC